MLILLGYGLCLLGYGICLELALVVFSLLFAASLACLLVDEGTLRLGPFVHIVVVSPAFSASPQASYHPIQASRLNQKFFLP